MKDRIISMKKEKKYIEYILKQAEALLAIDSPSTTSQAAAVGSPFLLN